MKKTIFALALMSLVGTAVFADDAAAAAQPEKPTYTQIRYAALSKEKADSITSGRVVFSVTGKNIPKSYLMLRAKKPNQLRFDMLKNGGLFFTAVRDGKTFWTYEESEGVTAMSDEDSDSFSEYIALMTIPFAMGDVFTNPVVVGEDENNSIKRTIYEIKPVDGADITYKLWIENKSRLLRKVEKTDENGKINVTMYRDYKDYNGVKMPSSIFISNGRGSFTMKLLKADWNLTLGNTIFDKNAKVLDPEIDALLKSPANPMVKAANEKKARDQKKIDQLEKKIGKLKIEIAAAEKTLSNMEGLFTSDRETVVNLAGKTSSSSSSHCGYWGGYGWHTRDTAADRDARTRRKVVREMSDEAKQTLSAYKAQNRKLIQMRTELDAAERDLAKLVSAQE